MQHPHQTHPHHDRGVHAHIHARTAGFAHPPTNVAALGIEKGMIVADFGAGSGVYTHLIAEALEGSGRVYAIDVQQDLLRKIKNDAHRRGYENVEVLWSDLEALHGSKIADKAVDLVLMSNILFQLPDKISVFKEARRILKPTGNLVVIDWSESFGGLGPQRDDVVSKDAALELARAAGFDFVREFATGAHHYGCVWKLAPHAGNER